MEIASLYKRYVQTNGVSTDSRSLKKGDTFIALKGENFDANLFVGDVLHQGAGLVITSDPKWSGHDHVVVVEDTLRCLQELSTYHRRQLGIPLLALTGSNGKTTTKELVAVLLRKIYRLGVTRGNLNNHIGVPLTLLSFDTDLEFGIVEMGANHQREIAALCDIAYPDEGFITNIGMAHLEGFGGIEGVKKGKGELYDHLKEHNKLIYVNESDPDLVDLKGDYENVIGYSDQQVPYGGRPLEVSPISGQQFCSLNVIDDGKKYVIETRLVGDYNYRNLLVALTVAGAHGVPIDIAVETLKDFETDLRRSQFKVIDGVDYILDCYNANPTSMMSALKNFFSVDTEGEKVVILGDMKELGDVSEEAHREVLDFLWHHNPDHAILVGPEFEKVSGGEGHAHFSDVATAKPYWNSIRKEGMRVLVKGSRSMTLEQILD